MDDHYGGIIWTKHALQRLHERGIKQGDAWATWRNPQSSKKGNSGSFVYHRTYGSVRIEVVAKQNEKGEWLILSVWSGPAYKDEKNKVSFWKFIFNKLFH